MIILINNSPRPSAPSDLLLALNLREGENHLPPLKIRGGEGVL